MYPYFYPGQLQYNYCPIAYRHFPPMYNSYFHNSFMNKELEDEDEGKEHFRDMNNAAGSGTKKDSQSTPNQFGLGNADQFLPNMYKEPIRKPDVIEQTKYTEMLKGIETQAPEVINTFLNLGLSKEASRLLILRIIELINKP